MTNPLDIQVGGSHYKNMAIQPVEYCHKNRMGGIESSIIRYICRWREKNGLEDLAKIPHYIDLLMVLEPESTGWVMARKNAMERGVLPVVEQTIPWGVFTVRNNLGEVESDVVRLISTWRDTEKFGKLLEIKQIVQELIEENPKPSKRKRKPKE